MEAKETVLSVEHIGAIMQPCVSPTAQGVILAQNQAEITWAIAFEEGKKAGKREVVETYKRENPSLYEKYKNWWGEKLKKWGIDGDAK